MIKFSLQVTVLYCNIRWLCIFNSFAVFILSLKIDEVNKHLDQVAQANLEHKRDDVKKALQLLLRNTSALEQVWFFCNCGI